ncbi:MAG: DUF115 domain-containing protein [Saccharospirillaceae bacterium]|nr:DUF115 domain-containing protein [Saccharospirillaceae bacterium]MCD8530959.1 DUF115 domain-containing protein [Saccharospirillaceae bacterium]
MNLERLAALKVKNLSFIRDNFPTLFPLLNEHSPKKKRLNADTLANQFQLLDTETGQILINDAEKNAEAEVLSFINQCHRNNRLITVATGFRNTFTIPRFSAKKLAEIVDNSPLTQENFNFYPFDHHIPMLCIMGMGLGIHIEKLLQSVTVDHLVICERDKDELYASLFTIDWEELFLPFLQDPHKSVTLIVLPINNDNAAFGILWNHLVKQPPFFPTATVFYNHRRTNRNEKILARVRKDITMYYSLWGNYDDEINQLNNALHNFRAGIPRLRKPLREYTDTPVLIIGSGPSLDERMEWIRAVRNKAIIVSCGSARDVLRRNGIHPDFQVELESDYVAAEAYSRTVTRADTQGTTLMAAAQVPPKIFALYEDRQMYFKDSTAMASLFSENNVVSGCTPSATNAGLGVFLHLGFENLFLFGMDFGYIDPEKHHSKDSIYYTDENPEDLIDSTWDNLDQGMPTPGVQGHDIKTIPFLYTGKRRVEVEIASVMHMRALNTYNCSLGATIDNAEWLDNFDAFSEKVLSLPGDHQSALNSIREAGDPVTRQEQDEKLRLLEDAIRRVSERILDELDHLEISMESLSDTTYRIARFIEEDIYQKLKTIYYIFRGSVWFFLSIGYAHSYALTGDERTEFIKLWLKTFREFLTEWPEHYCSIVYRDTDAENDPMLTKMITEAVDGV